MNEIEARSETYTETRAFLKLLNNLTDIPLPTTLGSGYRVPGFEPYLAFLRDDVFLKFNSRGYQDPDEKVLSLQSNPTSSVLASFYNFIVNTVVYSIYKKMVAVTLVVQQLACKSIIKFKL